MIPFFKAQMLKKREQFHEKIHAAFVLNTSVNFWGNPKDEDISWLASAYPNSTINQGIDQGASYYTITPKL